MSVASLLVARGFVVSAPPSTSVRRLKTNLCPRARSGMLCLGKWTVLEKIHSDVRLSPRIVLKGRDECEGV